jgi:hypothetical protein
LTHRAEQTGQIQRIDSATEEYNSLPESSDILKKVRQIFDPKGNWHKTELRLHIREPRPQTPSRYSDMILNNETGYFKLSREYDVGELVRKIDEKGKSEIYLNGEKQIPEEIRKEYGLTVSSNFRYRNFYKTILGLPAELNGPFINSLGKTQDEIFNGMEVFNIPVLLNKPMITKNWEILISKNDYRFVALRFVHSPGENTENELIIFEGEYSINDLKIPRFRHWYLEQSREYLGSDIILGEIPGSSEKEES